ncbi:hypothetical protein PR048_003341, partial [Dryococelus australis]
MIEISEHHSAFEAGDSLLNEHVNSGRGNVTYISPTVQNELLSLIGKQIQETAVEIIKKAKFFTGLGDETTDISRVEQFFLCVGYVDIEIVDIKQDFLTFVPVYDVTEAGTVSTIKTELQKLGVDMTNLCDQGYGAAGAMSEQRNGVQAVIWKDYPKALYTHCLSHVLNLCLSYAAKSDVIRNCFFTISEVATCFRDGLEAAEIPNCTIHNYNDTRWVERYECVAVFSEYFLSIFQALELLIERGVGDLTVRTKASNLHSNLYSFEFIVTLLVMPKMLSITYHLSQFLQRDKLDLFSAMVKIDHVEIMVSEIRENCEKEFAVVYRNAQEKTSKIGVMSSIPRGVGTQLFRNNVEASTPEEYYRRVVFVPYLDEILMHLKD